jgi:hypothetical protein
VFGVEENTKRNVRREDVATKKWVVGYWEGRGKGRSR